MAKCALRVVLAAAVVARGTSASLYLTSPAAGSVHGADPTTSRAAVIAVAFDIDGAAADACAGGQCTVCVSYDDQSESCAGLETMLGLSRTGDLRITGAVPGRRSIALRLVRSGEALASDALSFTVGADSLDVLAHRSAGSAEVSPWADGTSSGEASSRGVPSETALTAAASAARGAFFDAVYQQSFWRQAAGGLVYEQAKWRKSATGIEGSSASGAGSHVAVTGPARAALAEVCASCLEGSVR